MIEIAESINYAKEMTHLLKGKVIEEVEVLNAPHRFCWLSENEEVYEQKLVGRGVDHVTSSAHYLRIMFDNGLEIACAEDVSYSYQQRESISKKNQLVLIFEDGMALEFKIKLYGFILLGYEKELKEKFPYYKVARDAIHPLDEKFTYQYFLDVTKMGEEKGSVKAALATEQHIPGLGNGTLQDILFQAKIAPKRKVSTLSESDKKTLYESVINTIDEMIAFGGRDLITSLYGEPGKYEVLMKNDRTNCPGCQGALIKEAYLGGKVIYCPNCQK
ncbi:MAG: hypothetical protein WC992_08430 [Acholeplasmataceae bacterium]